MPYAYTEDQLVEQPAIGLFAELGWTPRKQKGPEVVLGAQRRPGSPNPFVDSICRRHWDFNYVGAGGKKY